MIMTSLDMIQIVVALALVLVTSLFWGKPGAIGTLVGLFLYHYMIGTFDV